MPTGSQDVAFTAKKILGLEDFRDRIIGRVMEEIRQFSRHVFTADGVFDTAIPVVADGSDMVKLSVFSDCSDGDGHILTPNAELGEGIAFANNTGDTYKVGLHYAQRPRGIEKNPRTGITEIRFLEDTIGEQGAPNSVSVSGAGLRFNIDSLTEAGISNAGRTAVVWKKQPGLNAVLEAEVIEVLTVDYDGNNFVTSAGIFGQPIGAPSTTVGDYEVTVLGPSIRKNTDLAVTAGYTFLGILTGNGPGAAPASANITAQTVIDTSLSGLNDITRLDVDGHLKVSVKADPSDSGDNQIEVRNSANAKVFEVDENGNVHIAANLLVDGTTTTVIADTAVNLTLSGNLTAGDADGDSHVIRGSWTHHAPGAGPVAFVVDGATGHVGVGATFDPTAVFKVTGLATYGGGLQKFTSSTEHVNTALTVTNDVNAGSIIGDPAKRWKTAHIAEIIGGLGGGTTYGGYALNSVGTDGSDDQKLFAACVVATAHFEMLGNFAGAQTAEGWRFRSIVQNAGRDAFIIRGDGRVAFADAALTDVDAPAKIVWNDTNTAAQTILDSVDRAKLVVRNRATGVGTKAGVEMSTGAHANAGGALWYQSNAIGTGTGAVFISAIKTKTRGDIAIDSGGRVRIGDFLNNHATPGSLLEVRGADTGATVTLSDNGVSAINNTLASVTGFLTGSRASSPTAQQFGAGGGWYMAHDGRLTGSKALVWGAVAANMGNASGGNSYMRLLPGTSLEDRSTSFGLAVVAGRSKTGVTTALELVAWSQHKSIVCKARFNSGGTLFTDQAVNVNVNATHGSTGVYVVTLAVNLDTDAGTGAANIQVSLEGSVAGQITAVQTSANQITVHTFDGSGAAANRAFAVLAVGQPSADPGVV